MRDHKYTKSNIPSAYVREPKDGIVDWSLLTNDQEFIKRAESHPLLAWRKIQLGFKPRLKRASRTILLDESSSNGVSV